MDREQLLAQLAREHDENVARLVRIEEGIKHLDGCLDSLKKDVIGMESRISVIEKWVWRTTGILAAGFGVVNIVLLIWRDLK